MNDARIGIHRRWSRHYLRVELQKRLVDVPGRTTWAEHESEYCRQIEDWLHGKSELASVNADIRLLGLRWRRLGALEVLGGTPLSKSKYIAGVALGLFAAQTSHANFVHWARKRPPVDPTRRLRLVEITHPLAMATAAGWLEPARRLCAATLPRISARVYRDADPNSVERKPARLPFGWFVLKLVADWAGLELPHRLPHHPYPAPPYEALLATWRHGDPDALVAPLLAACDWHTHECIYSRSDDPARDVDFMDDSLMGWPLAAHMVFRLRDELGLALPTVEHPVLQSGLGCYLPRWPDPPCDLLRRARARAIEDHPELDVVLK